MYLYISTSGSLLFLQPFFNNEHNNNNYLYMTIDQPVELNVVVVFAKGSDEHFRHFQPSDKKAKLQ